MNLKTHRLLIVPTCLALASNLTAGVLPILNGSFEAETIDNPNGNNIINQATFQPTGIFTGWGATSFTNSFGSVSNSTALFTSGLTGTNSYRLAGPAFQNTGHTFTAGVTYTISLDVGRVLGATTTSGMEFGFRKADNSAYVAGTTFVSNAAIPLGTFQTFTFNYTALPADQGNPINIRIYDYYTGNTDLRVDNVRLSDDTVGAAATLTTLSASPTSSIVGIPVTLSATVTSTGTPDGSVTFYDGVTSLGTGTLNGSGIATLTTTALPAGNRSITATYEGSVDFLASTSVVLNYKVLQNIALQNPGFEEGAGYLGGTPLIATALPGWQLGVGGIYGSNGGVFGNVGNQTAVFTSGLGGTNALYVGGGRLVQTAAETFETGRTYTFSIDIGNPTNADTSNAGGLAFGFRNSDDSGYLSTSFISGATVAAIPAGTFQNFRLSYTATAADNGNPIQISLEDYFASSFYRLDNLGIGISPNFASWAEGFGLEPDSELVDSDFDGISNLLEYAQNSSPISNTSGVRPTVVLAAIEGETYLRLTTTKNPDATDLSYVVESSPDLVEWGIDEAVVLTNTATSLVARDAVPLSPDQPKRFLRLKVSR